jgi:hypothetical protein
MSIDMAGVEIEGWIWEFEDAWARSDRDGGAPPDLAAFVVGCNGDEEARRRAVAELAPIDLERRCKRGEPARVEEYLARFPELTADRAFMSPEQAQGHLALGWRWSTTRSTPSGSSTSTGSAANSAPWASAGERSPARCLERGLRRPPACVNRNPLDRPVTSAGVPVAQGRRRQEHCRRHA